MRVDVGEVVAPILAERQRFRLVDVLAIDVVGQRYGVSRQLFTDAKRGIRKNDVGLPVRIQKACPKCGNRRLAFPGIQGHSHGPDFLKLDDANGYQGDTQAKKNDGYSENVSLCGGGEDRRDRCGLLRSHLYQSPLRDCRQPPTKHRLINPSGYFEH